MRPVYRPRFPLLALVVLLAASTLMALQPGAADPGDSVGPAPGGYRDVYVGTPTTAHLSWGYEGTNEGCAPYAGPYLENYQQGCNVDTTNGTAQLQLWIPTGAASSLDARAGLGLGYNLVQRCAGQQAAAMPMTVSASWSANPNFDVRGDGSGYVDVWGNALNGRDALTGEGSHGPTGPVGGTSTFLHEFNPPSWSGSYGTFSQSVQVPTLGAHQFLLYAHAHAQTNPTPTASSGQAYVGGSLGVSQVSFRWADVKAPTIGYALTDTSGYALPAPVVDPDYGYKWYRQPVRATFSVDDDFSCPKQIAHANGVPYDINYAKDPVVETYVDDGFYDENMLAWDYASNVAHMDDEFGIDRVAPTWTLRMDPPAPTGANGWYNGSALARAWLECADATSGCSHSEYSWNGAAYATARGFPQGLLAPQGPSTFACRVFDHSTLQDAGGCGLSTKYDSSAPTGASTCKPVGGGIEWVCASRSAYNADQDLRVPCADATSGCWFVNVTIDDAPTSFTLDPSGDQHFLVAGEGAHWVDVRRIDHAGNPQAENFSFLVDKTPPTTPTLQETHGAPYIATLPTWSFQSSDALSGVSIYQVYVNGALRANVTSTSWTYGGAPDGQACAHVVAVDRAGNPSAPSPDSCVFVDRRAPTLSVASPLNGWVYRYGSAWQRVSTGAAVALGDVPLSWSATDPGAPTSGTGLARLYSRVDGANWTPALGSSECAAPSPCSQTYALDDPAKRGKHLFALHATDLAGNDAQGGGYVDVVDLVASSGTAAPTTYGGAQVPYVDLDFLPALDTPSFQFWSRDIYRGTADGFSPTALTTITVANFTNPAATHVRDTTVLPGNHYYYLLVTKHLNAWGQMVSEPSVYYPARTPSAGATQPTPSVEAR